MEIKEPDRSIMTANLLVLAAATVLGNEHPVAKELLYISKSLSHHPLMFDAGVVNVANLGLIPK